MDSLFEPAFASASEDALSYGRSLSSLLVGRLAVIAIPLICILCIGWAQESMSKPAERRKTRDDVSQANRYTTGARAAAFRQSGANRSPVRRSRASTCKLFVICCSCYKGIMASREAPRASANTANVDESPVTSGAVRVPAPAVGVTATSRDQGNGSGDACRASEITIHLDVFPSGQNAVNIPAGAVTTTRQSLGNGPGTVHTTVPNGGDALVAEADSSLHTQAPLTRPASAVDPAAVSTSVPVVSGVADASASGATAGSVDDASQNTDAEQETKVAVASGVAGHSLPHALPGAGAGLGAGAGAAKEAEHVPGFPVQENPYKRLSAFKQAAKAAFPDDQKGLRKQFFLALFDFHAELKAAEHQDLVAELATNHKYPLLAWFEDQVTPYLEQSSVEDGKLQVLNQVKVKLMRCLKSEYATQLPYAMIYKSTGGWRALVGANATGVSSRLDALMQRINAFCAQRSCPDNAANDESKSASCRV